MRSGLAPRWPLHGHRGRLHERVRPVELRQDKMLGFEYGWTFHAARAISIVATLAASRAFEARVREDPANRIADRFRSVNPCVSHGVPVSRRPSWTRTPQARSPRAPGRPAYDAAMHRPRACEHRTSAQPRLWRSHRVMRRRSGRPGLRFVQRASGAITVSIRSVDPVLPGRVIGPHLRAHEAKYGSDVGGADRGMD